MKVFVLVPIHNRREMTMKFMDSFANQSYRDYQMVIVDDGSTDGSSQAILEKYPNTIIIYGNGNLWWTGAMRKGIEYILSEAKKDDYILAINDDVVVKENYIEELVLISKMNNNAIVGSMYRDFENNEIIYDSGVKIDWKRYVYLQISPKEQSDIEEVDTLATRGTIIPIQIFKNIGSFEKKLRHYAADYEYFLRAKKLGYKLYISKKSIVYGTEKKAIEKNERIQSFFTIWKRNFSLKSSTNLYNHLFLIWNYCPYFKYKIRHSVAIIGYNLFLFFNSIFLYPFKILCEKKNK